MFSTCNHGFQAPLPPVLPIFYWGVRLGAFGVGVRHRTCIGQRTAMSGSNINKFGKKFPAIVVPTIRRRSFETIVLGFR